MNSPSVNPTPEEQGQQGAFPLAAGSAICSAAHGVARGDYIVMNGLRYRVTSVQDVNSFTLRKARWYDLALWHLKRAWKWITGFLPNKSDQLTPGVGKRSTNSP